MVGNCSSQARAAAIAQNGHRLSSSGALWDGARPPHPPSCSARAPCTHARKSGFISLWMITAHVEDAVNGALLAQTVSSVQCFHPLEPIVVVDNDSPRGLVDAVLASKYESLRIIRQVPSIASLASMMVADDLLGGPDRPGNWDRVVFLMHSTHLCSALPGPKPGCEAMMLAGMVRMARPNQVFSASKLPPRSSWIGQAAEAMGLSLCGTHAMGTGCLAWGSANHAVVSFTRRGWTTVSRLRVWPREADDGRDKAALSFASQLPVIKDIAGKCAYNGTNDCNSRHPIAYRPHDASALNMSLFSFIVGMDRLAGIYVAAANAETNATAFDFCQMPPANVRPSDGAVFKTHGMTGLSC